MIASVQRVLELSKVPFGYSPSFISVAEIKYPNQNQQSGGRSLFPLTVPGNSPSLREIKAETQDKILKTDLLAVIAHRIASLKAKQIYWELWWMMSAI